MNPEQYWGTIGFAFFMYEGIGSLLPVMRETEKPEKAPLLAVAAFATLFKCSIDFVVFRLGGKLAPVRFAGRLDD